MKAYTDTEEEKKRKRRGMFYSFGIHSLLLILILFPFLQETEQEFENVVVVEFNSGASMEGSKASAKKGGASNPEESRQKPREITKVQSEVFNTPPEILTSKNQDIKVPKATKRPEQPKRRAPVKVVKNKQTEAVETPRKEPSPMSVPKTKKVEKRSPENNSGTGESGESKDNGSGEGNSESSDDGGSGNNGEGEKGKGKSSSGKGEDGSGSGLFGDIGKLQRAVEYRPNLAKALQKSGTIKFRLCVNQMGDVKKIAYEPKGSTITDKNLVRDAISVVNQYKFVKSNSGMRLECGVLTINVDIDSDIENNR